MHSFLVKMSRKLFRQLLHVIKRFVITRDNVTIQYDSSEHAKETNLFQRHCAEHALTFFARLSLSLARL